MRDLHIRTEWSYCSRYGSCVTRLSPRVPFKHQLMTHVHRPHHRVQATCLHRGRTSTARVNACWVGCGQDTHWGLPTLTCFARGCTASSARPPYPPALTELSHTARRVQGGLGLRHGCGALTTRRLARGGRAEGCVGGVLGAHSSGPSAPQDSNPSLTSGRLL